MAFKIPQAPGKGILPGTSLRSSGTTTTTAGAKRKQPDPVPAGATSEPAGHPPQGEQGEEPQQKRPLLQHPGPLTRDEEILELIESNPASDVSSAALKKAVLQLERCIPRNVELRAKFAGDPMRFLESEQELDEQLKHLTTLLSGAPHLFPMLLELGLVQSLLSLVVHENTDISNAVLALLAECTDDESLDDDGASPEADAGLKALVASLVESDCITLLVQNLARFDAEEEEGGAAEPDEDRTGIYYTLAILENFISIDATLNERIAQSSTILPWILARLRVRRLDGNRQYCAELLSIFLMEPGNVARWGEIGGMEGLLSAVAPYKRRDPGEEEVEFLENLFDCMGFALAFMENKRAFLNEQGIELMAIMLTAWKRCRTSALKVLALLATEHEADVDLFRSIADRILEACEVRTLIHIFRQKGLKAYRKLYASSYSEREEEENVLTLLVFLFKYASDVGALTKACSSADAVTRMVDLHYTYAYRLAEEEPKIQESLAPLTTTRELSQADIDLEFYLARCDVGLYTLQTVDVLIARACQHNPVLRPIFHTAFEQVGLDFAAVHQVLEQMASGTPRKEAATSAADLHALLPFVEPLASSRG